jgi:hypothetical protein
MTAFEPNIDLQYIRSLQKQIRQADRHVLQTTDSVEKVRADFSGVTKHCCATWTARRNAANDGPTAT